MYDNSFSFRTESVPKTSTKLFPKKKKQLINHFGKGWNGILDPFSDKNDGNRKQRNGGKQ